MEELSNMIIKFFTDYGWQLGICVLGGIFVLGLLKMFGVFDWIKNAQVKKFIYIALSVIFSVGACAIYLYITNSFDWMALGTISIPVFALNQTVYQLYENLGIRTLWKKLLNAIANGFGKMFVGIKSKLIISLGSNGLRKLADKIDEQKDNEAKQLVENAAQNTNANSNRNLYNKFNMHR